MDTISFPIVDVHAHLTHSSFGADLPAVLRRARAAGVTHVVAVGEHASDNEAVLALAARTPGVLPALGLYPEYVGSGADGRDPCDTVLEQVQRHRPVVAMVGEVGLDYWLASDPAARGAQRRTLGRLVAASRALDLPLSVHSRSAGHHAIQALVELGARRVCLHAFDGRARYASEAAVDHGFYLSCPPSIVRSPQKQKMVAAVPLSRLLLESDAPVLGPTPGERNEPAQVLVAAAAIAEIKREPLPVVLRACYENSVVLLGESVVSRAALAADGPRGD